MSHVAPENEFVQRSVDHYPHEPRRAAEGNLIRGWFLCLLVLLPEQHHGLLQVGHETGDHPFMRPPASQVVGSGTRLMGTRN